MGVELMVEGLDAAAVGAEPTPMRSHDGQRVSVVGGANCCM